MTRLIRAEALRLATTRTYWLLAAGAIAVIAGGIAPTAAASNFTLGTNPARSVLACLGGSASGRSRLAAAAAPSST